jgi:hypothetical protein
MKLKEIVEAQNAKYKERTDRALNLFGPDTEFTDNQINIAMEIGRSRLMEYSKEKLIRKFIDKEDLIYIGLIETANTDNI